MNTNTMYKLSKNLDLQNENFLVKKGTIVTVSKLFDETDNNKPTVVSLKFENIIGEYQFDENDIKSQLENNILKLLVTKFNVGDSVKTPDFGEECGIILEIKADALAGQRYIVVFSEQKFICLENQLSKCP
jgi:hypothetical protein